MTIIDHWALQGSASLESCTHRLPRGRGMLGSRDTCVTKGLSSLGALEVANPKLTCPVWWPFLSPQVPAFSTPLCNPVPGGESIPQNRRPHVVCHSLAAAAQSHRPRTEVGEGCLAPEHWPCHQASQEQPGPRLVGLMNEQGDSLVCCFSPGGGLCLLAAHREGPGGSGPGLGGHV